MVSFKAAGKMHLSSVVSILQMNKPHSSTDLVFHWHSISIAEGRGNGQGSVCACVFLCAWWLTKWPGECMDGYLPSKNPDAYSQLWAVPPPPCALMSVPTLKAHKFYSL